MKKNSLILLIALLFSAPTFAYENQGFSTYKEDREWKISFTCTQQCVILLWDKSQSDYVKIDWLLQWDAQIAYGFAIGQNVTPAWSFPLQGNAHISQKFLFSDFPYISQIPSDAKLLLLIQWSAQGNWISLSAGKMNFGEKIKNWISQAMTYKPYAPTTINFLDWPMWNGKYINEVFFWWMVGWLLVCYLLYATTKKEEKRKKMIRYGVGILVFFWIFFDFFSTMNQTKIYEDIVSKTDKMQNGRVGKTSDFYQFLDFIRNTIPKGEKGFFVAPYPFDFEGRYHSYPHLRIGTLTWSQVVIVYNPYGQQNPFNFVDPTYNQTGGVLVGSGWSVNIEKEIIWKPYAKIYFIRQSDVNTTK